MLCVACMCVHKCTMCMQSYIRTYCTYSYVHTIWPEILGRNLFWWIGGFESNPPIFHPPNTSQPHGQNSSSLSHFTMNIIKTGSTTKVILPNDIFSAICQNIFPPNFPAIWYIHTVHKHVITPGCLSLYGS